MNTSDRFESLIRPKAIPAAMDALVVVADRIGKIAQAVVLVAGAVPDRNNLLTSVVDNTLGALSLIQNIELSPESATVTDVQSVDILIRHTIQSLDLCHIAGLVSDMNSSIIRGELEETRKLFHEKLNTYCIGQVTYPFRIPEIQSETSVNSISIEHYLNPREVSEKKTSSLPTNDHQPRITHDHFPKKPVVKEAPAIRSPFRDITEKPHTSTTDHQSVIRPVSGEDKKERRDAIMRTIRSKGQVTIKDIAENIRGCSEKTIQRDLQELIQHGVLIREGEKRWAVYKLAMNNV